MIKKINVLLTSVGVATGPNVISSLKLTKDLKFKIIGTDIDWLAAGLYLCDKKYITPKISDSNYIENLLDICRNEKIDVMIPLLSKEISIIAEHKTIFERLGVRLAVSDIGTIRLCNDKNLFARFLLERDLPGPKIFSLKK